jgi:succinyl-CoA synthetase beta subunit
MKLLEYEAFKVLLEYQVPVVEGEVADDVEDVLKIADNVGYPIVIKAQVHTGGRGKAGGVKMLNNKKDAENFAANLIGSRLITAQTDEKGLLVEKVLVAPAFPIYKEFYVSITVDRDNACFVFVVSTEGGMDIEKTAKESPEKIQTFRVYYTHGVFDYQFRAMAYAIDPTREYHKELIDFLKKLYSAFVHTNAQLIEINPLAINYRGEFKAIDVKMDIDKDEEEGLSYVRLKGNVGCMVNGAGLAMATMDLIKSKGGEPANFLDIGGGANEYSISEGFDIIQQDENVKAILVNIFGGIVRCDLVAKGIINSCKKKMPKVNIIVRLQGTNAKEGLQLLKDSGLDIIVAEEFDEAVTKALETININ